MSITPEFAFKVASLYLDKDILAIGTGSPDNWQFELVRHVMEIYKNNRGCHIYLVGHRDEERPTLLDPIRRTHIPFFAVHVVPMESEPPLRIACRDMSSNDQQLELALMKSQSLDWKQCGAFPSGEKVWILESSFRCSARTCENQSAMQRGGHVWFPSETFKYSITNPLHNWKLNDEVDCDHEVWGTIKPKIKQSLDDMGVSWEEFSLSWADKDWVNAILDKAVDGVIQYFEMEEPDATGMKQTMESVLCKFKKERNEAYKEYMKRKVGLEQAKHYKVYPENAVLQEYLRQGRLEVISSSCKALSVFPVASPQE